MRAEDLDESVKKLVDEKNAVMSVIQLDDKAVDEATLTEILDRAGRRAVSSSPQGSVGHPGASRCIRGLA